MNAGPVWLRIDDLFLLLKTLEGPQGRVTCRGWWMAGSPRLEAVRRLLTSRQCHTYHLHDTRTDTYARFDAYCTELASIPAEDGVCAYQLTLRINGPLWHVDAVPPPWGHPDTPDPWINRLGPMAWDLPADTAVATEEA